MKNGKTPQLGLVGFFGFQEVNQLGLDEHSLERQLYYHFCNFSIKN